MIKKYLSSFLIVTFLIAGSCFHPFVAQAAPLSHGNTENITEELVCSQQECINCCKRHESNNEVALPTLGGHDQDHDKIINSNIGFHTQFAADLSKHHYSSRSSLVAYSEGPPSHINFIVGTVLKRE